MLLPAYPQTADVWEALKNESRPLVIYGMGNGAEKLLSRFAEYGISYADFFASDGFVRGHAFHGSPVLSFKEICEKYPSFCIVLSFATNRPEVLHRLYLMNEEYGIIMPDLPVVGSETFTADFYNRHYAEIAAVDALLADEESRLLYREILHYKLTGNIAYLSRNHTVQERYSLLPAKNIRVAVDSGAYNGDTIKEILSINPEIRHIVAIEPDRKNYNKLCRTVEELGISDRVFSVRAAASDELGEIQFSVSGNRNSSIANPSYKTKTESVPAVTVDSLSRDLDVDYVKYDVEGAELSALKGSLEAISRSRPCLSVSAYHRSEDIFRLPLFLAEKLSDYRLYYRRTASLPAWELHLIAVPKEKEVQPL